MVDLGRVARVATGVVHPASGSMPADSSPSSKPGIGVARTVGRVAAGGGDDGERTALVDVEVAHVGVERVAAVRRVEVGVPVAHRDRIGGEVEQRDLVAGAPLDRGEVADDGHSVARRRDLHLDDVRRATVPRPRHREVELGGERTGGGVEAGEVAAALAADGGEQPTDVERGPTSRMSRTTPSTPLALNVAHERPVGQLHPRHLAAVRRVHRVEVAADVHRRAVARRDHRRDGTVEHRSEVRVDQAGGGVERSDVVAVEHLTAVLRGVGDLGERATDDHGVAHLPDRVDLAVEHVRGEVRRVGGGQLHRLARGRHRAWVAPSADPMPQRHRECTSHHRTSCRHHDLVSTRYATPTTQQRAPHQGPRGQPDDPRRQLDVARTRHELREAHPVADRDERVDVAVHHRGRHGDVGEAVRSVPAADRPELVDDGSVRRGSREHVVDHLVHHRGASGGEVRCRHPRPGPRHEAAHVLTRCGRRHHPADRRWRRCEAGRCRWPRRAQHELVDARAGCRSASSWAIIPPIDSPTTVADAAPIASSTSTTSSARSAIVNGDGAVRDQPDPRLSMRTTSARSDSRSTSSAGHSNPDAVHPFTSTTTVRSEPRTESGPCQCTAGRHRSGNSRSGASCRRASCSPLAQRCASVRLPMSVDPRAARRRCWCRTAPSYLMPARSAAAPPLVRANGSSATIIRSVAGSAGRRTGDRSRPAPIAVTTRTTRRSCAATACRWCCAAVRRRAARAWAPCVEPGARARGRAPGRCPATRPARHTTAAASTCPNSLSATPTTATSSISGWWLSSSSTSPGKTFSPPDTIMSSSRPSTNSSPSSKRPRSPDDSSPCCSSFPPPFV